MNTVHYILFSIFCQSLFFISFYFILSTFPPLTSSALQLFIPYHHSSPLQLLPNSLQNRHACKIHYHKRKPTAPLRCIIPKSYSYSQYSNCTVREKRLWQQASGHTRGFFARRADNGSTRTGLLLFFYFFTNNLKNITIIFVNMPIFFIIPLIILIICATVKLILIIIINIRKEYIHG